MKDDKNMNEKENKGAEKSSRDRRLDAYRDWILDMVERLEDIVDELDELQEDLGDDQPSAEIERKPEIPFPPVDGAGKGEMVEVQITVILPDGTNLEIPAAFLEALNEH